MGLNEYDGGIKAALSEYEAKVKSLRESLKAKILALPDNPRIHRLGPRCFVMMSSDMFASGNWTAEFHDFKHQYEYIAEMIDTKQPKTVCALLDQIVEKGSITRKHQTVYFHPDVRAYLRNL